MRHIICFTLFIVPFCSYSQKIEDYSLKHSMKQDGLALTFTVLDPDEKGIKHYDNQKTYYWYKSQKVLGTQGGSAGQLLHGAFESFYDNKQLCEKGCYEKGLKTGEWNYWQKNGKLARTEHWNNGRPSGEQVYYSKTGEVQKRIVIHGNKSTEQSGDTLIEISRSSKTITLMDSIGRIKSVARYKNHLLHGKQEIFASDGTKSVETYKNGELVEPKEKKRKTDEVTPENDEKSRFFKRLKERFSKKDKADKKIREDKKPKKEEEKKPKPAKVKEKQAETGSKKTSGTSKKKGE